MLDSFLMMIALLLVAVLAACGAGDDSDNAQQAVPSPITADITGQHVGLGADDTLLAWIGFGSAPGRHSSEMPGEVAFINVRGQVRSVLNLAAGTSRVTSCGERSTSPDGRYFAFYAGGDTGRLYLVRGKDAPVEIAGVGAMACLGMGSFRYAPDSSRFGYINYAYDESSRFRAGTFHVVNTSDHEQVASFEDAVAFDLANAGAVFVRLFADSQGETREAGVFHWTSGSPSEVTTLFAPSGCQFRNAQIAMSDEDSLVVLLGHNCTGRGSGWALYVVDVTGRSAALLLTGDARGSYFPARAETLLVSPDGTTAYFSVPDGLTLSTVNLHATSLADAQHAPPLAANVIMPRFVPNRPYDPAGNAPPAISSNGQWLAVTTNDANNNAAVHVIDLNSPNLPPITINAGGRSDTVSAQMFTADSQRLLFVAGGYDSGNNSLFAVDLDLANDTRIMRGRYGQQVVVTMNGNAAALVNWEVNPQNYQSLAVIDLVNSQSSVLFTGAGIVDNRVIDQRFIYPLAWRR
jgi:hypothetical protein